MSVAFRTLTTALSLASLATFGATAHAKPYKVFLSMSYIGNDWQAEAANMVKAMAASMGPDKLTLETQVSGPNPQRQIQQINAMVQAGANAIVVYPISPTALNQAIKNACDQGVVVVAYDSIVSEPCAYNTTIDQDAAGRKPAEWLVKQLNGKGNIVLVTGVPGTSVDTARTAAAKDVFSKNPGIKVVAEANGMWSQAVARTELLEDLRDPPSEGYRRRLDAGRLLHVRLDAGGSRDPGRREEALRRRRFERTSHPDAQGWNGG